jgi:zona occludens toxin
MSIFFLEGIPGAGKSYESVLRHLLPALKAGRAVVTNVAGIDLDKIKIYLGLSTLSLTYIDIDTPVREAVDSYLDRCAEMNRPATQAQQMTIAATVAQEIIQSTLKKDALYILDEIQNYYGSSSSSLPPKSTRFFSEHRHQGLDIVLMGQNHRDVHDLIKHRIEILTRLEKLSFLGLSNSYKWVNYTFSGFKPNKIGSGTERYDKKIYSLYQSHDGDTKNKSLYKDARNNLFQQPMFKFGMPLALILLVVFSVYLKNFFFGENNLSTKLQLVAVKASGVPTTQNLSKLNVSSVPPVQPYNRIGIISAPIAVSAPLPIQNFSLEKSYQVKQKSKFPAADFYDDLLATFRARFSSYISNSKGDVLAGYLDLTHENQIVERIRLTDLIKTGYRLQLGTPGIRIYSPNEKIFLASAWPVDSRTTEDHGDKFRTDTSARSSK